MTITIILISLITLISTFNDPPKQEFAVYRWAGGERMTKEALYSGDKSLQMDLIPINGEGEAVGDTLRVLIQHRDHNDKINRAYMGVDLVIACYPAYIPQLGARRKALMNYYMGQLGIKRLNGGDVLLVKQL